MITLLRNNYSKVQSNKHTHTQSVFVAQLVGRLPAVGDAGVWDGDHGWAPSTPPFWRTREEFCTVTVWNSAR